ncbi:MAG: hypothetical protein KDD53_06115 [Bdellovibrionales bacterium]|nr:hypothetical protein [Bdellovibrionales bacterium]
MSLNRKKDLAMEVSKLIAASTNPFEELFEGLRELLGFKICWLKQELHSELCAKHGIDPNETETILMQASGSTECHLHAQGSTLFRTLGPDEGFTHPQGSGVLTAMYQPGKDEYELETVPFEPGEFSLVVPYQIHSFFGKKDAVLTALGVVSPRIRNGEDQFDVIDFEFTSPNSARVSEAASATLN